MIFQGKQEDIHLALYKKRPTEQIFAKKHCSVGQNIIRLRLFNSKDYITPFMQITEFETEDVITESTSQAEIGGGDED